VWFVRPVFSYIFCKWVVFTIGKEPPLWSPGGKQGPGQGVVGCEWASWVWQADAKVLKLRYFGIDGLKANGIVQHSLGQRPRNKEKIGFLWPAAIFILDRNGSNMAVGQQNGCEMRNFKKR